MTRKTPAADTPQSAPASIATRSGAPAGLTLADVALALGRAVRPQQPHENDRAVMASGMSTSDFSKLLAEVARVIERRYTRDGMPHELPPGDSLQSSEGGQQ